MPVELKDLADYLGYNDETLKGFENADALKADVDKQFIRRATANKDVELRKAMFGEMLGSQETAVKASAKKFGIEFKPEEIAGKSPVQISELALEKFAGLSKSAQEELKKQIGAEPDEKYRSLEEKFNKQSKKVQDYESMLEATKNEFNSFKENTAKELKNSKLNFQKEQLLGGIAWKPGIKDIEKQGFLAIVDKSVNFDFDETGKFVITDKEGHLIPNKAKHGEHLSPEEWLKDATVKNEVIAINPHAAGKPAAKTTFSLTNIKPVVSNGNGEPTKPLRKIGTHTPNFRTMK